MTNCVKMEDDAKQPFWCFRELLLPLGFICSIFRFIYSLGSGFICTILSTVFSWRFNSDKMYKFLWVSRFIYSL